MSYWPAGQFGEYWCTCRPKIRSTMTKASRMTKGSDSGEAREWPLARIESTPALSRNLPDAHKVRIAKKIEPAIRHMLQHTDRPLRISALSAIAKVSGSHFYLLFKSATGYGPHEFFIRLRMRRACELLRDQNLSVKQAAARLGYDDQFYFSRRFKAVVGLAPNNYRKRLLDSEPAEKVSPRPGVRARIHRRLKTHSNHSAGESCTRETGTRPPLPPRAPASPPASRFY